MRLILIILINVFVGKHVFAQENFISFKSASYSPSIILNENSHPFYQKFETDFVLFDNIQLRLSQGSYSTTYNIKNSGYRTSDFFSFTGFTNSVLFIINPVEYGKLSLELGCGASYILHKEIVTVIQIREYINEGGAESTITWQNLDLAEKKLVGLDCSIGIVYRINKNFALFSGVSAIGSETKNNFSYGFISLVGKLVFSIDSKYDK